jgi:hypothetical protein
MNETLQDRRHAASREGNCQPPKHLRATTPLDYYGFVGVPNPGGLVDTGTTTPRVNVGKRLVRFPNLFVSRFAYLFVNGVKRLLNGVVNRLLNGVTNRLLSGVMNGLFGPGNPLDNVGKNGAFVAAAPNVFVNGLMTGCSASPG